jgi:hypothetical protein
LKFHLLSERHVVLVQLAVVDLEILVFAAVLILSFMIPVGDTGANAIVVVTHKTNTTIDSMSLEYF